MIQAVSASWTMKIKSFKIENLRNIKLAQCDDVPDFVVMQIGDSELDTVYDSAIGPAILAAGLWPRGVDRHNGGDLLNSEIMRFIEGADLIVADLTEFMVTITGLRLPLPSSS